jgi:hydroxyacylglutathione hydrolase
MILVKTFYAYNELRNFSYLIQDSETGHSWVIDPYEAQPIIDYIKKNSLVLKGILNTHQHFDHIRGNALLVEAFSAPVHKLKNLESLDLGSSSSLHIIDTPGHTLDHQVFTWRKGDQHLAIFSGDTLFNSGVGNCKGGGDVNLLYKTIEKLKLLPGSTLVYPGHDYKKRNLEFAQSVEPDNQHIKAELNSIRNVPTEELPPLTLGQELLVNPFLRLDSEEVNQNVVKNLGISEESDTLKKDIFIRLRQLRDIW